MPALRRDDDSRLTHYVLLSGAYCGWHDEKRSKVKAFCMSQSVDPRLAFYRPDATRAGWQVLQSESVGPSAADLLRRGLLGELMQQQRDSTDGEN
jgi:hypothetical protein